MKTFIGVKLIKAERMTRGEYFAQVKPHLECLEDPSTEGYHVVYPDGYDSWSPAGAFEVSHFELEGDGDTIREADVDRFIYGDEGMKMGQKTTVVRAVLCNGYEIVESSSCVDPKNYDPKIGRSICMDRVRNQVWGLLGFLLQSAKSGFRR